MLTSLQALAILQEQITSTYRALDTLQAAIEAEHGLVRAAPQIALIQQLVATHFGYTRERLLRRDRHAAVALARQVAMTFSREFTRMSLGDIARDFGDYDHDTISWALRAVKNRADVDADFARSLETIKERVREALKPLAA